MARERAPVVRAAERVSSSAWVAEIINLRTSLGPYKMTELFYLLLFVAPVKMPMRKLNKWSVVTGHPSRGCQKGWPPNHYTYGYRQFLAWWLR